MLLQTSAIEKVGEFTRELESNDIDKVEEKISQLISDTEPAEKSKELLDKVAKCLRYYSDLNIPKPVNQKEKKNKGNKTSKKGEQKVQKPQAVAAVTTTPVDVPTTDTTSPETEAPKLEDDTVDGVLPSDTEKLEVLNFVVVRLCFVSAINIHF